MVPSDVNELAQLVEQGIELATFLLQLPVDLSHAVGAGLMRVVAILIGSARQLAIVVIVAISEYSCLVSQAPLLMF